MLGFNGEGLPQSKLTSPTRLLVPEPTSFVRIGFLTLTGFIYLAYPSAQAVPATSYILQTPERASMGLVR